MANQVSGLLSPWLRRQRLKAATPFLRGQVLDYGCGVGMLAGYCLPQAYVGVDIDEESLTLAKQQYPRYRFEREIPEGETFDTVVALAVIEHLPMPAMFLQRCACVLKPSGHVVLTTPHPAGDRLHMWGAKIGLFSASAHEEHEVLIDHAMMQELAAQAKLVIQTYQRFLFGGKPTLYLEACMSKAGPIVEGGVIAGNLYDKYGTRNPIARFLMSGFYRAIAELVEETGTSDIHEVGCGEGHLSAFLAQAGRSVRASDFSVQVIAEARAIAERERVEMTFKAASIYDLTPREDSASLVVCCEVLEHLTDPHRALRVLTSLAHPYLLVSVPREPVWRVLNMARGQYLSSWGDTPGHIQHWSKRRFLQLLREYVDVVRVLSPVPWTVVLTRVRQ